ncbi:endonuclease/exonuclease/phosphatase family protein [Simkania sp.]|uniref:endonuclease/exonuclease/phosphatase family protein n=1 Tax=Simkania sp. TaxID=34094 RepID=UPI003B51F083
MQIFLRLRNIVNLCLLFLLSTAYADIDELPYIKNLLSKNSTEIEKYWSNYEKNFNLNVQAFLGYLEGKEGAQALRAWGENIKQTLVGRTDLGYLIPYELYPDTEFAKTSLQHYEQINNLYARTVKDEDFQNAIANYVLGVKDLLPDEAQFYYDFLSRFQGGANADLISKALDNLTSTPKAPYIYLEGTGAKKVEGAEISILNANLLFMPQDLTYYFGGVRHWKARILQIAKALKKKNSDIVCLQEIHDEESAFALFRALKRQYPYFYLNVGTDNAVIDPDEISMNSGLFVASKYPILEPRFIRFESEGRQKGIHKGFFYGTIVLNEKPFCYLISTHLNPHDNETAIRVREEEAQMIVQTIETLQKDLPLPAIVVGDLNVSYGTQEWKSSSLSRLFIDGYSKKHPTCTDYFNDLVWTPIKMRSKVKNKDYIYDYALMYHAFPIAIESEVFHLYRLDDPTGALSDHQGIFSQIK